MRSTLQHLQIAPYLERGIQDTLHGTLQANRDLDDPDRLQTKIEADLSMFAFGAQLHALSFLSRQDHIACLNEMKGGFIDTYPLTKKQRGSSLSQSVRLNPQRRISYEGIINKPMRQFDDWYKNAKGDIVWFENNAESFSNHQGRWVNVGANLNEVAVIIGLPSGSFEFLNTEWILFGARASGGSFMGLPAPVSFETNGHFSTSFDLSNAGKFGWDRIDGKTQITRINFTTQLSVSTSAPGVAQLGVGGYTSLFHRWTPTGKHPQFTAPLRTDNREIMYRSGQSEVTGTSNINISLGSYYRKSRGYSRPPTFDLGVNPVIPIRLQQNGKRKVLDISGKKNF